MSIQDELFKSIEILIQKALEKQNLNRTVASTVEAIKGSTYKCNIDGAYYFVKNGTGLSLSKGTAVWIHVPGGKMNNAFIMGKR